MVLLAWIEAMNTWVLWHVRIPNSAGYAINWVRGRGWIDSFQRRAVLWAEFRGQGRRWMFLGLCCLIALRSVFRPLLRHL